MSFKMAGILAFKTVAPKCKPVLLEPLDEVDVIIPDDCLGDVLGDLSSRRAHILVTEPAPADMRGTRVRAIVPQSEQTLEVSRVAYQADRLDFLALIDSQRTLLDAHLNYFRALSDRELALADLSRAVGVEVPAAVTTGLVGADLQVGPNEVK
jgi:hypothetical protein